MCSALATRSPRFQSTLPSEERSDCGASGPRRRAEAFQSTLPSEERSDLAGSLSAAEYGRFNPRSPPKRGATLDTLTILFSLRAFQSTLPSEERSDARFRIARA